MSYLSINPSSFFAGASIVTKDWSGNLVSAERMIRTDVALDNSVVVTDSGFSWGDSDMTITIRYKKLWYETLTVWLQAYPELVVCREDGVFRTILKRIKPGKGQIILQLSIIERIN